jgi:ABC-type nitrate/sulfonate/bicarbonate transport system substrate-binding protein
MGKSLAVAALVAAIAAATTADAADKLVLQLRGPTEFEFAGYYAALWQGFYRDAGIDVEIKPGTAPQSGAPEASGTDVMREVAEGRARFGVGSAETVVRAAQGAPLLLLAPIFQRSGAAIYYRADQDFASPGALAGAKVGRLPASNILDNEMATALKAEGVDPEKLNSVPLQPGQVLSAMADNSVDTVPGSAWDFPWLAHEKGIVLKSINPADYRVEFYGDTLFTSRHFAEENPTVVRNFRAASLKGWDYALRHPDEIAKRLQAELPPPPGIADAAGFMHYQAELARSLARFPAVQLGQSNPDRWSRIEASLAGIGALVPTSESDAFLYDPDGAARKSNDVRSFALLGGALVIGLALLTWFWRRRREPMASEAGAAPAAMTAATAPIPAAASSATTIPAAASSVATSPAAASSAATTPARSPASAPAAASGAVAPTPPVTTDLNAVLNTLDRAIRRRVSRGVSFRLSLLPELWRCRAERDAVGKLVLDLVSAAAADLKRSGELIVGTRNYCFDATTVAGTPGARLGEFVRITVRDNGPGLSDDALAHVLDTNGSARPSAAAASSAIAAEGGFVRVESAEGIGTAVHLYFPRVAATETAGKADEQQKDAAA